MNMIINTFNNVFNTNIQLKLIKRVFGKSVSLTDGNSITLKHQAIKLLEIKA